MPIVSYNLQHCKIFFNNKNNTTTVAEPLFLSHAFLGYVSHDTSEHCTVDTEISFGAGVCINYKRIFLIMQYQELKSAPCHCATYYNLLIFSRGDRNYQNV